MCNRKPVLVVPACEPGRGGGHLIRCTELVHGLRTLDRESFLFLSDNPLTGSLLDISGFNRDWLVDKTGLQTRKWEFIVLDRFRTSPEELSRWAAMAPVIGIDEGGKERDRFEFLIDILPNVSRIKPNISDPSLLPLPENIDHSKKNNHIEHPGRVSRSTPLKMLISFGQEDKAGLGPAVARELAEKNSEGIEIFLLTGRLQTSTPVIRNPLSGIRYMEPIPNLSEHLNEYDLIISHYGLTSFEALYAGIPVMLVSPSSYHAKLAKAAGFFSSGTGKSGAAKLARLLFKKGRVNYLFLDDLKNRCTSLAAKYNLNGPPHHILAELINSFTPEVNRNCPACGAACGSQTVTVTSLARFPERTYRRCNRCGVIFMDRLSPPPIEYDRGYFFEEYQKQYGKTYIEDFPNLTAMAKRRLAVIKSLLPMGRLPVNDGTHTPLLLDIGCAYGPFLAAAREEGFSPRGIDPSQDAVRYVTQALGIPAVQGFFPETGNGEWGIGNREYDVIALWYVIEHFRDCVPVLTEIKKLLKPGGILAFSTPSFSGISGRSSLRRFLENSPADHWTIWSPAKCKRALKTAGFTVKKIIVTGHHPERFPLLGKLARNNTSPLYGLVLVISKIFGLGDTFEVYAVGE